MNDMEEFVVQHTHKIALLTAQKAGTSICGYFDKIVTPEAKDEHGNILIVQMICEHGLGQAIPDQQVN